MHERSEEWINIECPTCEGYGSYESWEDELRVALKCTTCQGTGEMTIKVPDKKDTDDIPF